MGRRHPVSAGIQCRITLIWSAAFFCTRVAAYRARGEAGGEDQWEDLPDTENQETGLGLQPTGQVVAHAEQLLRADLQLLRLQSEESSDESSDEELY